MKYLEYEVTGDKTYVINDFDTIYMEIPSFMLVDFVERYELNITGDSEPDFFEQRDDDGKLEYLPIDVAITIDAYEYLENNTEEVVKLYLEDLLK